MAQYIVGKRTVYISEEKVVAQPRKKHKRHATRTRRPSRNRHLEARQQFGNVEEYFNAYKSRKMAHDPSLLNYVGATFQLENKMQIPFVFEMYEYMKEMGLHHVDAVEKAVLKGYMAVQNAQRSLSFGADQLVRLEYILRYSQTVSLTHHGLIDLLVSLSKFMQEFHFDEFKKVLAMHILVFELYVALYLYPMKAESEHHQARRWTHVMNALKAIMYLGLEKLSHIQDVSISIAHNHGVHSLAALKHHIPHGVWAIAENALHVMYPYKALHNTKKHKKQYKAMLPMFTSLVYVLLRIMLRLRQDEEEDVVRERPEGKEQPMKRQKVENLAQNQYVVQQLKQMAEPLQNAGGLYEKQAIREVIRVNDAVTGIPITDQVAEEVVLTLENPASTVQDAIRVLEQNIVETQNSENIVPNTTPMEIEQQTESPQISEFVVDPIQPEPVKRSVFDSELETYLVDWVSSKDEQVVTIITPSEEVHAQKHEALQEEIAQDKADLSAMNPEPDQITEIVSIADDKLDVRVDVLPEISETRNTELEARVEELFSRGAIEKTDVYELVSEFREEIVIELVNAEKQRIQEALAAEIAEDGEVATVVSYPAEPDEFWELFGTPSEHSKDSISEDLKNMKRARNPLVRAYGGLQPIEETLLPNPEADEHARVALLEAMKRGRTALLGLRPLMSNPTPKYEQTSNAMDSAQLFAEGVKEQKHRDRERRRAQANIWEGLGPDADMNLPIMSNPRPEVEQMSAIIDAAQLFAEGVNAQHHRDTARRRVQTRIKPRSGWRAFENLLFRTRWDALTPTPIDVDMNLPIMSNPRPEFEQMSPITDAAQLFAEGVNAQYRRAAARRRAQTHIKPRSGWRAFENLLFRTRWDALTPTPIDVSLNPPIVRDRWPVADQTSPAYLYSSEYRLHQAFNEQKHAREGVRTKIWEATNWVYNALFMDDTATRRKTAAKRLEQHKAEIHELWTVGIPNVWNIAKVIVTRDIPLLYEGGKMLSGEIWPLIKANTIFLAENGYDLTNAYANQFPLSVIAGNIYAYTHRNTPNLILHTVYIMAVIMAGEVIMEAQYDEIRKDIAKRDKDIAKREKDAALHAAYLEYVREEALRDKAWEANYEVFVREEYVRQRDRAIQQASIRGGIDAVRTRRVFEVEDQFVSDAETRTDVRQHVVPVETNDPQFGTVQNTFVIQETLDGDETEQTRADFDIHWENIAEHSKSWMQTQKSLNQFIAPYANPKTNKALVELPEEIYNAIYKMNKRYMEVKDILYAETYAETPQQFMGKPTRNIEHELAKGDVTHDIVDFVKMYDALRDNMQFFLPDDVFANIKDFEGSIAREMIKDFGIDQSAPVEWLTLDDEAFVAHITNISNFGVKDVEQLKKQENSFNAAIALMKQHANSKNRGLMSWSIPQRNIDDVASVVNAQKRVHDYAAFVTGDRQQQQVLNVRLIQTYRSGNLEKLIAAMNAEHFDTASQLLGFNLGAYVVQRHPFGDVVRAIPKLDMELVRENPVAALRSLYWFLFNEGVVVQPSKIEQLFRSFDDSLATDLGYTSGESRNTYNLMSPYIVMLGAAAIAGGTWYFGPQIAAGLTAAGTRTINSILNMVQVNEIPSTPEHTEAVETLLQRAPPQVPTELAAASPESTYMYQRGRPGTADFSHANLPQNHVRRTLQMVTINDIMGMRAAEEAARMAPQAPTTATFTPFTPEQMRQLYGNPAPTANPRSAYNILQRTGQTASGVLAVAQLATVLQSVGSAALGMF